MLQMRGHTCGSIVGLAFVLLVTLAGATVCPIYIEANIAEATTGTAVDSVLTFDSTNLAASIQVQVESPTGTFVTSSANEKAAFSISTNNYTGYTLTMKSTGSNTNLGDNSSHNISTLDSSTTLETFSSSSSAGRALNNKWGYIPNYYNASGASPAVNTTNYYPAPTSSNAATLRTTSSANSSNGIDNADNYTIGLGLRVNYDTVSGTYANDTFLLEYVANPVTYLITYDKNTNDTVTDMPYSNSNNQQGGDALDSSITLSNAVPVRADYDFLGWCFGTVSAVNGADTCSGTVYNPNGGGTDLTFGIDQTATNAPTLYAMWNLVVSAIDDISDLEYMQDFATLLAYEKSDVLDSMTVGQQYQLKDSRDEKPYYISKLADGNVWMTQNLDHDIKTDGSVTYDSTTTDIPSAWTPSTAIYATNDTTWISNDNYLESYDPGDYCWSGTLEDGTLVPCAQNGSHFHLGNYYNWNAAVAINDSSSYGSADGADADQSICPAGWALPKDGSIDASGSFQFLVAQYGWDDSSYTMEGLYSMWDSPLYFPLSGEWDGFSSNIGDVGNYWSSVTFNNNESYYSSYTYSGNVEPGYPYGSRYRAKSVRCLLRPVVIDDISDLRYMQDFATLTYNESVDVLASMTTDQQYQLKDNRDQKDYYISKLADGNIWMTQNLDHDIVTTQGFYTYANTDIGHGSTPNTSATWTASVATRATNNTSWDGMDDGPESYDPGDVCWNGTIRDIYSTGTIASDTTSCGNDRHYHIGNYYNWTAAVAMDDSSNHVVYEHDVEQSICPAGWRLPTFSGDNSYSNLVAELSLTPGVSGNVQSAPVYFAFTGSWSVYYQSSISKDGFYWTSTVDSDSDASAFGFYATGSTTIDDYGRHWLGRDAGYSVRCQVRPVIVDDISELRYMQDFVTLTYSESVDVLASMTTGQQYQLKDNRDEKSYYISKLADGNVWMTQNLDHDIKTDGSVTYDSTTTDIPSVWTPSTATYATNDSTWNATVSAPESYDPGDYCWSGRSKDSVMIACDRNHHFHLGNYYNWTAAVAMNDSGTYTVGGTDVNQSICPAGWTLPKDGSVITSGSFQYLVAQYGWDDSSYQMVGSYSMWDLPLFSPLSGSWTGSLDVVGYDGNYWSSVVYGSSGAYRSNYAYGGDVTPDGVGYRHLGSSIRCLLRHPTTTISDLEYMQDFASLTNNEKAGVLASMTVDQQYQLKDNRDQKDYYISKLSDGNVWMTQNLDHDIVAQANYYTPANTDIPSDWTPSIATYATNNSIWNDTYDGPESYDPGDLCWSGTIGNDDNGTIAADTVACGNDRHYHIGNYYNWTAAIAMNDNTDIPTYDYDADQSICPAGWRLPTSYSDKSYTNLISVLNLTSGPSGNVHSSPVYFVYGGEWYGSSRAFGWEGYYQTSIPGFDSSVWGLLAFSGNDYIDTFGYYSSYDGQSVRCVAR